MALSGTKRRSATLRSERPRREEVHQPVVNTFQRHLTGSLKPARDSSIFDWLLSFSLSISMKACCKHCRLHTHLVLKLCPIRRWSGFATHAFCSDFTYDTKCRSSMVRGRLGCRPTRLDPAPKVTATKTICKSDNSQPLWSTVGASLPLPSDARGPQTLASVASQPRNLSLAGSICFASATS